MDNIIRLEDYGMAEWTVKLHDRVITRFKINEGSRLIIGRGSDADVVIDNTAISRHHSALELRNGVHFLSDLESLNGTTVNGKKIKGSVAISEKDDIGIGKFTLSIAPITEKNASSKSYASPMDIDDETVFVSQLKKPQAVPQHETEKTKHTLSVIEGQASPGTLPLTGKSNIKIGKDQSCDMVIEGWLIAKAQCYIVLKKGKYYIVPQSSWSSTRLNEVTIKKERVLRPGDIIEIRRVKLRFN